MAFETSEILTCKCELLNPIARYASDLYQDVKPTCYWNLWQQKQNTLLQVAQWVSHLWCPNQITERWYFVYPACFYFGWKLHWVDTVHHVEWHNNQLRRKPETSSENMRSYVYYVCCVLNFLWASVNSRQQFGSNWQHEVSNAMDTFGCCFGSG